jgi:hypothetical protein
VAFFLSFRDHPGRFRLLGHVLHHRRRRVVEEPLAVHVRFDDPRPPTFAVKGNQFAADDRDERNIPAGDRALLEHLDRVHLPPHDRPVIFLAFDGEVLHHQHRAGFAVAFDPFGAVDRELLEQRIVEARQIGGHVVAGGILLLPVAPFVFRELHPLGDEGPFAIAPIGFGGERIKVRRFLVEQPLDDDARVVGALGRRRIPFGQDAIGAAPGLDRAFKGPRARQIGPGIRLNAAVQVLNDFGGVVVGVFRQRMDGHAEMRVPLFVQFDLNRLIQFRDRQHRPFRQAHAADGLAFAGVARGFAPLEFRDLELEGFFLAFALFLLGFGGEFQAFDRLLDDAGLAGVSVSIVVRSLIALSDSRRSSRTARSRTSPELDRVDTATDA